MRTSPWHGAYVKLDLGFAAPEDAVHVSLCTVTLLFSSPLTLFCLDVSASAIAVLGQQQVGQLGLVQLEYFRTPKFFVTLRNGLLDVRRDFQDCMYVANAGEAAGSRRG